MPAIIIPAVPRGLGRAATTDAAPRGVGDFISSAAEWTFAARVFRPEYSGGSTHAVASFGRSDDAGYASLRILDDQVSIECALPFVVGYPAISGGTLPLGRWVTIHGIFASAYIQVAVDGVPSSQVAITKSITTPWTRFAIGELYYNGSSAAWKATNLAISAVALWPSALTEKEIRSSAKGAVDSWKPSAIWLLRRGGDVITSYPQNFPLARTPPTTGILFPPDLQAFDADRRILYFPSAGGGGATLTADSGTYTLTGTAATLKADRKLAADSGSYAITGTDVSLKLGRKLTAESGTYTVNGTDVSLTAGRKLTADSGTYALTGTDVTLTYQPAGGYTLALDSGSYTLTGTAATLKASRKLTADSGTYALTGTDVTLTRGFKITADSGTYTLTGSNVAFARTYRLPADSGSYALSGSPVSLSWSGEVVPVAPTHGGPSIYGKAVFREAEFKREYEREVSRIENERIRAIQMREDEELVIIMAALAA